jgi:two-component sensor histidine kinase
MDMNRIRKQNILEQSIYWVLWILVFSIPLIGLLLSEKTSTNQSMGWRLLGRDWLKILPFFIIFLANNYILLPYLLLRKKYLTYIITALLLVVGLCLHSQYARTDFRPGKMWDDKIEISQKSALSDRTFDNHQAMPNQKERQQPQSPINQNEEKADNRQQNSLPPKQDFERDPHYDESGPMNGDIMSDMSRTDHTPPPNMPNDRHDRRGDLPQFPHILSILLYAVLGVTLFGFNIAIKLVFQSFIDEEKMKELEKEKLSTELQYLKYQINPHFFMNTLNNIHALVDIDQEKAKSSIIELSKLMRYILYEANNTMISLSKELQFIDNYVTLMKLRFTDKVQIDIDVPPLVPEVQVPPLLFITFLENAFKHGVSYQQESFIKLKLQIDEPNNKIIFFCSNRNLQKVEDSHHGIGLENVNKRLKLIYESNYTLSIDNNQDKNIFEVLLIIPLRS